jgi:hypothetical protein
MAQRRRFLAKSLTPSIIPMREAASTETLVQTQRSLLPAEEVLLRRRNVQPGELGRVQIDGQILCFRGDLVYLVGSKSGT